MNTVVVDTSTGEITVSEVTNTVVVELDSTLIIEVDAGSGLIAEAVTAAAAAAASAAAALVSENAAAASETAAGVSETNAAASESNASTSETNAATSETNAATSETNAGIAQTAAEAAQTAAEAAQTAAELAETNAETAETNAAASESAAATSESNAATSESNAATSETNAATSETNAAASYDAFDDRYLGAKSSEPTLDNDGDPLIDGALFFDTTTNTMKVYDLGNTTWLDFGSAVTSVNTKNGVVVLDPDDLNDAATTNKFTTAANLTKLGHITITQAVDLDAIETRVNALDAAVILQGTWDASAGTFPGGGTAQAGDSYIVSVGGTVDSEVFTANDRIVAITDNASTTTFAANWHKLDYTDAVLSVAGGTGAVSAASLIVAFGGAIQDLDTLGANTGSNEVLVGTAAGTLAWQTGATLRTTLGLGTGDSPQFTGIELGHATDTTFARVSAGVVSIEGSNILLASGLGSITQAYDADTLKADTADVLTAAFEGTLTDDGTKSSGTYTPTPAAGGQGKKIINGGAFTLAPYAPASNTFVVLDVLIVNGGSSGAITTSGFTKVTGDAFTTTSTDEFACRITIYDTGGTEYSHLDVVALQ